MPAAVEWMPLHTADLGSSKDGPSTANNTDRTRTACAKGAISTKDRTGKNSLWVRNRDRVTLLWQEGWTWGFGGGETEGLDSSEEARNSTLALKALNLTERPDVGREEGPRECRSESPGPPFLTHTDHQLARG